MVNEKDKILPKQKIYYDIKIETMVPAILTYRVLAEDPQQAILLIKNIVPTIKYKLGGKRDIKMTVYDAGSTIIRFIKNLVR